MENDDKRSCLCNLPCATPSPLLSFLPGKARLRLVRYSSQKDCARGETLFREGQPIRSVLFIVAGKVKLCRYDAEGEEHIFDILHDGDTVWDGLLMENTVYPYAAVCLTPVRLCLVGRGEFLRLLGEQPQIAMTLISLLGRKLRQANEKNLLLSVRDPRLRLAGFLLDRDRRCIGPDIELKLDDIAASVGLRPETVSRGLSRFERDGLIRRTGQGRILVVDRPGREDIYRAESQS